MTQLTHLLTTKKPKRLFPNQLRDLALWLDAEDVSSFTQTSGAISAWSDRSVRGNHATQATSGQRPVLAANQRSGKSGVVFTTDSLMIASSATTSNVWSAGGYAALVMENRGAPQGTPGFGVMLSTSGWFASITQYTGGAAKLALHQYCSGTDNQWRTTSYCISDNTPVLVEFLFNGSTINRKPKIFVNGVLQALEQTATATGTPDNDSSSAIGIMGWHNNDQLQNVNGVLYEVIATRTIPNLHERNALRRHLAMKWGLTVVDENYVPVYILSGQSNMLGLSTLASAPSAYTGTQSNVKIWNGSGFASLTAGTNNGGASSSEFGPELSFARDAAITRDAPIYLIKYAASGKSLAVDFLAPSGTNCVALKSAVTNALANLTASGLNPIIMGYCWMQGENDADNSAEAAAYQTNLAAFISHLRIYFAEHANRDAPFLIGEISTTDGILFPYVSTVRAKQQAVAANDASARSIATNDLGLLSDHVHFDTAAQIALGQRFAQALLGYNYPVSWD